MTSQEVDADELWSLSQLLDAFMKDMYENMVTPSPTRRAATMGVWLNSKVMPPMKMLSTKISHGAQWNRHRLSVKFDNGCVVI
jgi:hypothetical protein